MKKILRISTALCACIVLCASMMLAGCGKTATEDALSEGKETEIKEEVSKETDIDEETVSVTLNEVAHSIFYAPMYVAIEEGYFEEEGIEPDLVCGFGADKVMTAVLSGEADIGFMGPETTVYTANQGSGDQVVNFAQLTQRAGNFLVAREKVDEFQWSDLIGKNVLGGRAGGVHTSM